MKFYLNGKPITKKEAMKLITAKQLEEAREAFEIDPLEEQSWFVGKGILVVEF